MLSSGKKQYKTSTKYKTLNPVWNESFTVEFVTSLSSKNLLTISVWDKDMFSDDYLGHCLIDIDSSPLDGSSVWRKLQPRPGKNDKVKGEILISLIPGTKGDDKSVEIVPASGQVKSRIRSAKEEGITELDLTGCNLSVLPTELLENLQWTVLDLGFNQFSIWPSPIHQLKLLMVLYISGNQLTEIDETIGEMTQLKELYINGNSLISIPEQVSKLTNLEKLDLANNALKALPPQIGYISNLEELKLNGNPLKNLPKEIGNLSYLMTLDLSFCHLISLPNEFSNLVRLLELDLSANNLEALPSNMGNLTRLLTLNLADNKIKSLPYSMGNLKQINLCNIDGNPIDDPSLWKKYEMGTDHLIDYLDKKLFESEQLIKREAKYGVDGKKKKNRNKGQRPNLREFVEVEEKPEIIKEVIPREEVDKNEYENLTPEERTTRKRFKALEHSSNIKRELIDLKRAVMMSKTIEEAIRPSKAIRDLKVILDGAKSYLQYTEPIKPAQLFPNETKIQQLKKTVLVAMKDIEITLSKIINLLSTLIPEDIVDKTQNYLNEVTEYMNDYIKENQE